MRKSETRSTFRNRSVAMEEVRPGAGASSASSDARGMACATRLELIAVPGIALVEAGDDLGALAIDALSRARLELRDGDAVVVASKVISRSEGRFVDLRTVTPSAKAEEVGKKIGKDPRLVELILGESERISRTAPGVLIVRHRLRL